MKPDRFFSIKELVREWNPWDLTEEDLLKYGSENTLQFLIRKEDLLKLKLHSNSIDFYCSSKPEDDFHCTLASKQSEVVLSPDTLDELRKFDKSKVILSISCIQCQYYKPEQPQTLIYKVGFSDYFFHHQYEPIYDLDGIEDTEHLNMIYCRKDDLIVSREEKERFENKYLNFKSDKTSNTKQSTLLRAIGALLVANYNKSPYIDNDGKINANGIAERIIQQISEKYSSKGISERKLREIIPIAIETFKKNKI